MRFTVEDCHGLTLANYDVLGARLAPARPLRPRRGGGAAL